MAADRGLGKGLSALLGDAALQTQEGGSVLLSINQIEPGLKQPRKRFEPEALDELSDSIRQHGVIQPLTVRRLNSGYYQIIAGERRWRASKQAGLTEVPALIIEADDRKVMELGLIENLQRQDLNPIEESMGYRSLMEEHGLTQEEVATRVGKSRPAVANALRLIALPDPIRALVEEGRLSAGHGRALLSLTQSSDQKALAQKIIADGLSVRQVESMVKSLNAKASKEDEEDTPQVIDPIKLYRDEAAKSLTKQFGRKVSIVKGAKKGTLSFEFYDDEDLTLLLDRFEPERGGTTP